MANQRTAAVEDKIKNAEKIIQSYAYGKELDQAIRYLQSNDPENAVLATIRDFDNDRPMLKALNALYRADQAREEKDTAELEKIAEFLSMSKNKELRKEALNIMRSLPEFANDQEKAQAAEAVINVGAHKPKDMVVDDNGLSDDEIVLNADKIDYIIENEDFQSKIYAETIKPAKEKVTIIDEDGKTVENEDDIWVAKMMAALGEVSMHRMDDAAFAAKKVEEQREDLKEDIITNFWKDMDNMAGASADNGYSEEAEKDSRDNKNVKIKANQFFSSIEKTKDEMAKKADAFEEAGKKKSGSWLRRKLDKLNKFSEKHFGITPVEFGKDLLGYFSHARGITNTALAVGLIGTSMISIPAGLAGAAAYGLYQSFAPSQWSILEKKNANLKAAKASGNEDEIRAWSGRAGLRHAYNAIQASPKEKSRFDSQKRRNMKYGIGSAAIVAAAAPVIMSGGLAAVGLGLGAAATYLGTRLLSSGVRMTGANANAYAQMKDAKKYHEEDQTAESEKGYKKARTYFYAGLLGTGLAEFFMANNVADAYQNDYAMGVEHNPNKLVPVQDTQNEQGIGNDNGAPAVEDTPVEITHANWREGITGGQANWISSHIQGQAAEYAKIYHWPVNPDDMEAVAQKMADNIQTAIDNGALPDKPVGEIMYKYLHLIAWREKGEFVSGGLIQSTMVNGEPDYWTNATEIKALNHIIFCEEKPGVSAEDLGKVLDRITASGDDLDKSLDHLNNNRYVGTADLMHKAGDVNCAHVSYWEHIKSAVKKIVTPPVEEKIAPAPEPAPAPAPAPLPGHADDGAAIGTVDQMYDTSTHKGMLEVDEQSIDYAKPGARTIVKGTEVEAGAEKTSATGGNTGTGNGEQAFNAMLKSKMGNSNG